MQLKSFQLRDVKAAEAGKFSGAASVYGVLDNHGDIVMPGAFSKTIAENNGRIKILSQHNPSDVIGSAILVDTAEALMLEGQLELELQSAKDAYVRLKAGLIDALSIGYESRDDFYDRGVRMLKDIKLWEVSLVTFPANEACRITAVKSAESGIEEVDLSFYLKAFESLTAAHKAGRALSAANLSLLKDCYEKLGALLALAAPAEEDEDAKAAEAERVECNLLEQLAAGLKSIAR
jgi:uncharacterized protein